MTATRSHLMRFRLHRTNFGHLKCLKNTDKIIHKDNEPNNETINIGTCFQIWRRLIRIKSYPGNFYATRLSKCGKFGVQCKIDMKCSEIGQKTAFYFKRFLNELLSRSEPKFYSFSSLKVSQNVFTLVT
jgi:hypothetical protein